MKIFHRKDAETLRVTSEVFKTSEVFGFFTAKTRRETPEVFKTSEVFESLRLCGLNLIPRDLPPPFEIIKG